MTETQTPGNAVATVTIPQFITQLEPEIQRALPKGMDGDRIARLALTVVRQSELQAKKDNRPNNSLMRCSVDSFAGALLTAAALGLEPGVNQEAYLVPYGGEATLIVGYQGLAKLFWQHPLARDLDAQAVHERDEFDYSYGLHRTLTHRPAKGERGAITHYYAVAELTTGASHFVVLTADEVKELRGGKVGPSGRIADPMHWMERKTALRQLFKTLPKSSTLVAALAVDEHKGSTLAAADVPAAIASGDSFATLPPSVGDEARAQARADAEQRVTADEIVDAELVPDPSSNCGECGLPAPDHDRECSAA